MAGSELTVRDLFVTRGGRPVLRDISLSVPPGEITALLGANGAGKSTLVLTIAGILPALRGGIFCDGRQLLGHSPDAVRRQGVALVLEGHPVLTGLSVRDNLAAAALMHTRREADREIEAALETFPELRDRLSTAAHNLSGGQKQMVVIAQGMIARPRYLLIDELSFGLAPSIVKPPRRDDTGYRCPRRRHSADRAIHHARIVAGKDRVSAGSRRIGVRRRFRRAASQPGDLARRVSRVRKRLIGGFCNSSMS